MKDNEPNQQIPASLRSVLFCVQTPDSRLSVVIVIISEQFGVLCRCSSLDLCTHNLRRAYFFEHIWMCKHQQQKRKNCIFENAGEPLILTPQRLGRLWPPHEIGCAAWSEIQSCFFTGLTEDFVEKRLLEYLICFIT